MESNDSTTHANAVTGLQAAKFTQQDLQLLLPALIKDYSIDGENLNATNNQIAGMIKEIMNNSMVQFIQAKYLEIPKANGGLKQILIDLLAQYKTQLSYDVLRELLSTYCLLQLSAHLQD